MKTQRSHLTGILLLNVLILGFGSDALALSFAGGTGEPNTPYQIATAEQLIGMGNDPNMYNKCFVLTADIDLDTALPFQPAVMSWWVFPPGSRRNPSTIHPFEGCLDGRGHAIRNCTIVSTNSSHGNVGLLDSISAKGVVRNLRLEDVLVAGVSPCCAGLAGKNDGTIIDCSVTGTILFKGPTWPSTSLCAGLVGQNTGIIIGCHSDADVFGPTAGGLVGFNNTTGRVAFCSAGGIASGTNGSGGLICGNAGIVQYCSTGEDLVGTNTGMIRECYTTTGGLVGVNSGTIVNCYSTPQSSSTSGDGLASGGTVLLSYSTTRCSAIDAHYVYYLSSATSTSSSSGSSYPQYPLPLSADQMKQATSFVGFDFYGDANDGSANPWFMPTDGYPVLSWQTDLTGLAGIPDVSGLDVEKAKRLLEYAGFVPGSVIYDYSRLAPAGQVLRTQPSGCASPGDSVSLIVSLGPYSFAQNPGDGNEATPYQIATASQFESFDGQPDLWDKHFVLTADIDLNWYEYPGNPPYSFQGEFNGNGHTIRNLRVSVISATLSRSLFGAIASTGSVHDLNIEQPYFCAVGGATVGTLASQNDGRIFRCKATSRVFSDKVSPRGSGYYSTVGGLIGENTGQITDCSFSGRIDSGSGTAGGLAAINTGLIARCCARDVEVVGGYDVGGLVGYSCCTSSGNSTIEASYATGTVTGTNRVGGLVGHLFWNSGPSRGYESVTPPAFQALARQCYAGCSVTGQSDTGGCIGCLDSVGGRQESCFFLDPNDGGGPNNSLGTPLTADQMKHQGSFFDWDFTDTWAIREGQDYPHLRWEESGDDK